MTEDQFRSLIERSRDAADGDSDRQARELEQDLRSHPQDDLEAFAGFFATFHARLYRKDCWAAAELIMSGASDDGFHYFRSWVSCRGRTVYERALEDPDSLADLTDVHDPDGSFEAESIAAAVDRAYAASYPDVYELDEGFEYDAEPEPTTPAGPALETTEAIKRALPRLWDRRAG